MEFRNKIKRLCIYWKNINFKKQNICLYRAPIKNCVKFIVISLLNLKPFKFNEFTTRNDLAFKNTLAITFSSIFFKTKSEREVSPEEELLTIIKRSILCIQKQEFDKAEQMLHLALKVGQEMQLKDGVTYVYDLMANLAMEQNQFEKAEKLFTEVMKRLFSDGREDDNIKILHISSKIAHICKLKGEFGKAEQGFLWTIDKMEKKLQNLPQDKELSELFGLTINWYAQLLMDIKKYEEAKNFFFKAYEFYTKEHGKYNQEAITILNNLSVAYTKLGNYVEARKILEEAIELAKNIPELFEIYILKANLGLLYLQEGYDQKAKELCSASYRYGKQINNNDVIEQAIYCLNEIKKTTK